jgi:hypothetical protein
MSWGRWELEPLGAAIFLGDPTSDLSAQLDAVRPQRTDLTEQLTYREIELGALCLKLERQVSDSQYKAGFITIKKIMELIDRPQECSTVIPAST